jgi:hypothetical protein
MRTRFILLMLSISLLCTSFIYAGESCSWTTDSSGQLVYVCQNDGGNGNNSSNCGWVLDHATGKLVYVCSNAREIREEFRTDCTSTQWCIGFNEHCVDGQCVQKDPFNKCFSDFNCSLFDHCVDGVCLPK